MPGTTGAGSRLAISAAAPATQDKTGYTALTFTEVGGVEKLGPIGQTSEKVEFQPLNGTKQKFKGASDSGGLAPSIAYDPTDAGQLIFRAASDSKANYSFRVTYPDGAIRYAQGITMGWPEDTGGANNVLMVNPTVEFNTAIVRVDPTPAT